MEGNPVWKIPDDKFREWVFLSKTVLFRQRHLVFPRRVHFMTVVNGCSKDGGRTAMDCPPISNLSIEGN
jgi:hypothetical protein